MPAFRKPKSKNAATTLLLLGTIAVTMLVSIIVLAKTMGLRLRRERRSEQLRLDGEEGVPSGNGGVRFPDGTTYVQDPVIGQLAKTIFDNVPLMAALITTVTGLILVLAANTAFNGFPVLGSILAQDRYLPRQLHTRGDRLAYSNGIVLLALAAILLIVAFDAEVTRLIQLYIVGVFVSFTLSQTGMVRHWTRLLRTETDPAARARMRRSRVINSVGLSVTGLVLVVVLVTKFLQARGSRSPPWSCSSLLMKGIHRHYDGVSAELVVDDDEDMTLPSRTHAIVLVSKIHKPTLRAVNYARAMRPTHARGGHGQRRPGGDPGAAAGVGPSRHPHPAEGARLAVPRGHRPGHRLRPRRAADESTRPGHGPHPRVRRRPLVGAPPAQPERAAAQGQAAVHTRA